MSPSTLFTREQNQLLAGMQFEDRQDIEPHLELVEMLAGSILFHVGGCLRNVYFPTSAVVSLVSTMKNGATVEVAAVGNEGMVGVEAFMGSGSNSGASPIAAVTAQYSALVMRSGFGYSTSAQCIAHQAKYSEQVMCRLLNYVRYLFAQVSQTSACNRHHAIEQQLARWLLVHLDRQADDEMHITQECMASMLGVRRAGVTAGALRLQKAGVIRYGRGLLSVIDPTALEMYSCECYSVIRTPDDRLSINALQQPNPVEFSSPEKLKPRSLD